MDSFFAKKGIKLSRQGPHRDNLLRTSDKTSSLQDHSNILTIKHQPYIPQLTNFFHNLPPTKLQAQNQQSIKYYSVKNASSQKNKANLIPNYVNKDKSNTENILYTSVSTSKQTNFNQNYVSQVLINPSNNNENSSYISIPQNIKENNLKRETIEQNSPQDKHNIDINLITKKWQQKQGILLNRNKQLQLKINDLINELNHNYNHNRSHVLQFQTKINQYQNMLVQKDKIISLINQENKNKEIKINDLNRQINQSKNIVKDLSNKLQRTQKMSNYQSRQLQQTQKRMNKLMFFQGDLLHAENYHNLMKQYKQLQQVNKQLIQQHQEFIKDTTLFRKQSFEKINNLIVQLKQIKNKLQNVQLMSNKIDMKVADKIQAIKIQTENNYLKAKMNEIMQNFIKRQHDLEQALQKIKQLQQKQNKQDNRETINFAQFSSSVALYQQRLSQAYEQLKNKNTQVQSYRRQSQCLLQQLKQGRQTQHNQKVIQKSGKQCLKAQLQLVQKQLQAEKDIGKKKITTLQQKLQRKTRQLSQKDKFIKQFLIGRSSQIENKNADEILRHINTVLGQNIQTK